MWKNVKRPNSCRECRKLRLKCDETKPFCFKCQKNGRPCSGYVDWTQLPVRDMTVSTIQKFRNQKPRKHKQEEGTTDIPHHKQKHEILNPLRIVRYGIGRDRPRLDLAAKPVLSVNELAMLYLQNTFIEEAPLALDPGYSELMRLVLRLQTKTECLSMCLEAAALASFSSRANAKGVEVHAEKAYTAAISALSTAIQQPGAADDDQILASVLLLAFYESFRSNQLLGFHNHIFGAASIIKSRKRKKVLDPLPAQSYSVVKYEFCRTSLLGFASYTDVDFPFWLRWRNVISDALHASDIEIDECNMAESSLDHLVRSMVNFVVAKNPLVDMINQQGLPQTPEAVQDIVIMALSFMLSVMDRLTDMETSAFVSCGSRPLRLQPPVQKDSKSRGVYPKGPICVFKNMHHATFHFAVCVARASCFTHLMAWLSHASLSDSKMSLFIQQMAMYRLIVQQAQDDLEMIVSIIPYICGWTAKGSYAGDMNNSQKSEFAVTFLPWALVGPVCHPLATQEQKEYMLHMTQYLASDHRVRQAEALLDVTVQAQARSSMSHWQSNVMSDCERQIPKSWIGRGTSLERQIFC